MSKVIAITGGGTGLGKTLAMKFAEDGDKVILLGRTLSKLEDIVGRIGANAMAVQCDVADPESVKTAFATIAATYPKIDVLINNAAVFEPFLVEEATNKQIMQTVMINVAGPMLVARSAIPLLEGKGLIINVTSESVDLVYPFMTVYQSTKAAVERFGKSMDLELEPKGIRVTTVRAGAMFDEEMQWNVDPQVGMRFHQACMAVGMNLRERPVTHYKSLTGVFRTLIDMPEDLHSGLVTLRGHRNPPPAE